MIFPCVLLELLYFALHGFAVLLTFVGVDVDGDCCRHYFYQYCLVVRSVSVEGVVVVVVVVVLGEVCMSSLSCSTWNVALPSRISDRLGIVFPLAVVVVDDDDDDGDRRCLLAFEFAMDLFLVLFSLWFDRLFDNSGLAGRVGKADNNSGSTFVVVVVCCCCCRSGRCSWMYTSPVPCC